MNYERPSLNELCKRITVDIFAQCSGCLHREVEYTRHDVSTHDLAERLKKEGWQVSIVTDGLLCPICAADLQRKRPTIPAKEAP